MPAHYESDTWLIQKITMGLDDTLNAGIRKGAEQAAQLMRELAPFQPNDPGPHIIDSIEVIEDVDGSVDIQENSGHGLFVEFGTVKMAAQPFFLPALMQSDITGCVADELKPLLGL
jgi:HK97 gp10 family phage protein